MYAQEKPFECTGPLSEIPVILASGRIPVEFAPDSEADLAAIGLLQRRFRLPLTPELLATNSLLLKVRAPRSKLSYMLGVMAYPYVAPVNPDAVPLLKDELVALVRLGGVLWDQCYGDRFREWTDDGVYDLITQRQVELIHRWPARSDVSAMAALLRCANPDGLVWKWQLQALTIALQSQVRDMVMELSPQNLPQRALDFVLGKTNDANWFLNAKGRLAWWRGDMDQLEDLRENWAKLPKNSRKTFGFTNENPADFANMDACFGEACLETGWETAPNPRAWTRKVTEVKSVRHQREDEKEARKMRIAVRDVGLEGTFINVDDLGDYSAATETSMLPEVNELVLARAISTLPAVYDKDAINRVIDAKKKGLRVSESDRAKFRRARAAIKQALFRAAIYKGDAKASPISAANQTVYEERFQRPGGFDSTYSHVNDSVEKLESLKAILRAELREVVANHPNPKPGPTRS